MKKINKNEVPSILQSMVDSFRRNNECSRETRILGNLILVFVGISPYLVGQYM